MDIARAGKSRTHLVARTHTPHACSHIASSAKAARRTRRNGGRRPDLKKCNRRRQRGGQIRSPGPTRYAQPRTHTHTQKANACTCTRAQHTHTHTQIEDTSTETGGGNTNTINEAGATEAGATDKADHAGVADSHSAAGGAPVSPAAEAPAEVRGTPFPTPLADARTHARVSPYSGRSSCHASRHTSAERAEFSGLGTGDGEGVGAHDGGITHSHARMHS